MVAYRAVAKRGESVNGRANELSNGLEIALNKLANRIDYGFTIEIKVAELPELEEGEESETIDSGRLEKIEIIKAIRERLAAIEYHEYSGKPILKLKERSEGDSSI